MAEGEARQASGPSSRSETKFSLDVIGCARGGLGPASLIRCVRSPLSALSLHPLPLELVLTPLIPVPNTLIDINPAMPYRPSLGLHVVGLWTSSGTLALYPPSRQQLGACRDARIHDNVYRGPYAKAPPASLPHC